MTDFAAINCPSCSREIAREFGDWLWKVKNCPFCLAPLMPVQDDFTDGRTEFYFATEDTWR